MENENYKASVLSLLVLFSKGRPIFPFLMQKQWNKFLTSQDHL